MKVILIDAAARTVTEHEIPDSERTLDALYRLIGCELVEVAGELPNGDTIWCDECALLKERTSLTPWCAINGVTQPVCGNLVITGTDHEEGDTIAHTSDIAQLRKRVTFLNEHAVAVWARFQREHPFQPFMIDHEGTRTDIGEPPELHTHKA